MTLETATDAFARALRLAFGTRALDIASEQRDAAEGEPRRSWDAIVDALKRLAGAALS